MAELADYQKETARQMREISKETDRQMRERAKETDRQIRERAKETNRQIEKMSKERELKMKEVHLYIKENRARMRYLDNLFIGQWGKLMESLVAGDLIRLLQERDIEVNRLAQRTSARLRGKEYEYDLIAVNGNEIVVVEVKTTLSLKDVDHFIGKLKSFKTAFPEYNDRSILGAVAYLRANQGADKNSEKRGLYVIRATGNSATITNSLRFRPKSF